jgi:hypothetical protein
MQGKIELAEALGRQGSYEESGGGEIGGRELLEKAAGDERVFIAGRGSGWQMKPAHTRYRRRRAVSEVTGPLNRMAYGNSQVKGSKGNKDSKDSKNSKDSKDSKDSQDSRDSRDSRDSQDSQDSQYSQSR